ncbi:MAG: hypothetical protein ABIF87_02540 [Pseudomonadota bacterium]
MKGGSLAKTYVQSFAHKLCNELLRKSSSISLLTQLSCELRGLCISQTPHGCGKQSVWERFGYTGMLIAASALRTPASVILCTYSLERGDRFMICAHAHIEEYRDNLKCSMEFKV